ncbi:MAG: Flp pilus assembly complex ATPase component TadA [Candidatus Omnitrophica bacterium]|nr:Flp pilus assembly complex ATPase component TadA [Candidatus Omnitrophota bacterium]
MDKRIDPILTEGLLEGGLISRQTLAAAQAEVVKTTEGLAAHLVKKKLVPEDAILTILSEKLKLARVHLKDILVDTSVIEKVPLKIASYYKFAPVKMDGTTLTIAVSYPMDIKTMDAIRLHLGCNVACILTTEEDLQDALKTNYGLGAETIEGIISQTARDGAPQPVATDEKVEDIEKLAGDASVIKLVNQVILDAYQKRATDIHIEPYRGKVRFRYRIDGVLYDANVPPDVKQFLMPILSRIKIMSNLNIVERRLPQDGRAIVRIQDEVLDLRISTIPTPHGESLVMRILPTVMFFDLKKLGLAPQDLSILETFIQRPHGIIFVTGPTGSGKTTTLYAALSKIDTKERKVITIEDPIEYEMEGITQIQVNSEIGLDFARGLRSMLRHDPDVILVGEVRDLETAEIAIRVALTGHLVLSTLHTNDAVSGITRLLDMGLQPFLVASSVEGFIAQRLVRVLCPKCKVQDRAVIPELKRQIAQDLRMPSEKEVRVFKAQGCKDCSKSGYLGRTAIYEILMVDDEIRDLIMKKASSDEIQAVAVKKGMRVLRQDGWRKVLEGFTTPDEVMKVAPAEALAAAGGERSPVPMAFGQPDEEDAESPMPDERAFVRMEKRVSIRYKVFESLDRLAQAGYQPEQFGSTKDMSAGGIFFSADEKLAPGSFLELVINLPQEKSITCLAKIVRVEEVVPDRRCDVAACFLDLSSEERVRLNKFVMKGLR